jgi:hypothetical protein
VTVNFSGRRAKKVERMLIMISSASYAASQKIGGQASSKTV